MAKEPKRLNLDMDSLFPADTVEIAGQEIEIRPLGFRDLTSILRRMNALRNQFAEHGITWENYMQPHNIMALGTVILENSPDLLAEASNIHVDDIQMLPLESVTDILLKVIDVNMRSKEKLEKNFKSLTEKLGMTEETPVKKK